MLTKKLTLATAFTFLLAGASFAQTTYFNEPFNYPTGVLVGAPNSPWISISGTAGQVDVSNPSNVSGVVNVTGTESEDVSAPFTANGSYFTSGTIIATLDFNFSVLPTGAGTYFTHFRDTGTGFRGRVFAMTTGAAAGAFRLGISNTTTTVNAVPVDLSLNTTYSLTLSLDAATGISTLAVNGSAPVTATDVATPIQVSYYSLRQSTGEGTLTVDNIVVTSTAIPVPEPSAYAMIAGALGMLAFGQRMRRSAA